jgi:hypothetical protein
MFAARFRRPRPADCNSPAACARSLDNTNGLNPLDGNGRRLLAQQAATVAQYAAVADQGESVPPQSAEDQAAAMAATTSVITPR